MHELRIRRRRSSMLAGRLLAALALLGTGNGPVAAAPLVDYPTAAETVVVRYTERVGGIANPGGPSVTIYGDGRTLVHYPTWAKRAGTYALRLTRAEMDELVRTLVAAGVATFDAAATADTKRAVETARASQAQARGVLHEERRVLDASTTTIELSLGDAAAGARSPLRHHAVSWYGLAWDARAYPEVPALAELAGAEKRLRTFLTHPDLARVE